MPKPLSAGFIPPLNRYLLFQGSNYYASGGWADFAGSFSTLLEALSQSEVSAASGKWRHVVDIDNGMIIFSSDKGSGGEYRVGTQYDSSLDTLIGKHASS